MEFLLRMFEFFAYGWCFIFGIALGTILIPLILYELAHIYIGIRRLIIQGYNTILKKTKKEE